MIRKDETREEMILRGFEQKGPPEPPERVLANFEALPGEDRLWVYEMISGWMGQGGDGEGISLSEGRGRGTIEKAEREGGPGPPEKPDERWKAWAAVLGVIVVPSLLWASVLLVPFLPLTTESKVWVSGSLVVGAEGVFWVSALLLGREVARRYRRYLDPRRWFRQR